MAWSVNDLSVITQLLLDQLNEAVLASPQYLAQPFLYEVDGLMPAVSRTEGKAVLSVYLLHVSRDPHWRNTPVQGSLAQPNQNQPLSLNLSYLLTSYAEKNWPLEQLLMSIAFSCFHANPIYRTPGAEFTVTIEADTLDEMSRLWQAITVPIRLSALFRVAVVFLAPAQPPLPDARTPVEINLSVAPDRDAPAPIPSPAPRLFSFAVETQYRVPPGGAGPTPIHTPPVVVAGQTVRVRGSGLDQPDAAALYLTSGASEWPLNPAAGFFERLTGSSAANASELVFTLPADYAALPPAGTALTATPCPAPFTLSVGNAVTSARSNALPILFAPTLTHIGPGEPVLSPAAAQVYTFTASGLLAGKTQLLLESTPLTPAPTLAPGSFTLDLAAGVITFMLPSGLPGGSYARVRLLVNAIEAPPGWWVAIP